MSLKSKCQHPIIKQIVITDNINNIVHVHGMYIDHHLICHFYYSHDKGEDKRSKRSKRK